MLNLRFGRRDNPVGAKLHLKRLGDVNANVGAVKCWSGGRLVRAQAIFRGQQLRRFHRLQVVRILHY